MIENLKVLQKKSKFDYDEVDIIQHFKNTKIFEFSKKLEVNH